MVVGPEWLRKNKQDWPLRSPETKESRVPLSLVTAMKPTGLVESEGHRSCKKLRNAMAHILPFVENVRNKELVSAEDHK